MDNAVFTIYDKELDGYIVKGSATNNSSITWLGYEISKALQFETYDKAISFIKKTHKGLHNKNRYGIVRYIKER